MIQFIVSNKIYRFLVILKTTKEFKSMNNSINFNKIIFASLLASQTIESSNNGLEQIMTMLNQCSDDSRKARVNHNCVFNGIPFTWDYNDDKKVFTIPMHKISTGWDFFIDIEESGDIYLSEGKYTRRTKCNPTILMDLRPSIKNRIYAMLRILTSEHPTGEPNESVSYEFDRFEFYKLSYIEPNLVYGFYAHGDYKECQRIGNADKIVDHAFVKPVSSCENPTVYFIGKPQRDSENRYYRNCVILNNNTSIDGIDDIRNRKPDFKLMFDDHKLKPVCDSDTRYTRSGEIYDFSGMSGLELRDFFSGIDDSDREYFYVIHDRMAVQKWSEISEIRRPRIFVGDPNEDSYNYYDDIEEIDLDDNIEDSDGNIDMAKALIGSVRFIHDHSDED